MRVPEYNKSDIEFEQEKNKFYPSKWWQAYDDDIGLLAETSDRNDFKDLNLLILEGVKFRRMYEKRELKWVEEHPFPNDVVEWRAHTEYTLYEMNKHGVFRLIETKETLQPTLIGDEGYIGFLLKKGVGVYLKPIHELYAELFPELTKDETDD